MPLLKLAACSYSSWAPQQVLERGMWSDMELGLSRFLLSFALLFHHHLGKQNSSVWEAAAWSSCLIDNVMTEPGGKHGSWKEGSMWLVLPYFKILLKKGRLQGPDFQGWHEYVIAVITAGRVIYQLSSRNAWFSSSFSSGSPPSNLMPFQDRPFFCFLL